MSAKPNKAQVRKATRTERTVRVRKMWCAKKETEQLAVTAWSIRTDGDIPMYVITGYTGSAAKLKRLVEIAAMDDGELACHLEDALAKESRACLRTTAVIEFLGLSTAPKPTQRKQRAGGRK